MMKKNFPYKDDYGNCNSLRCSLHRVRRLRILKRKGFFEVEVKVNFNDTSSYLLSMFAIGLQTGEKIFLDKKI